MPVRPSVPSAPGCSSGSGLALPARGHGGLRCGCWSPSLALISLFPLASSSRLVSQPTLGCAHLLVAAAPRRTSTHPSSSRTVLYPCRTVHTYITYLGSCRYPRPPASQQSHPLLPSSPSPSIPPPFPILQPASPPFLPSLHPIRIHIHIHPAIPSHPIPSLPLPSLGSNPPCQPTCLPPPSHSHTPTRTPSAPPALPCASLQDPGVPSTYLVPLSRSRALSLRLRAQAASSSVQTALHIVRHPPIHLQIPPRTLHLTHSLLPPPPPPRPPPPHNHTLRFAAHFRSRAPASTQTVHLEDPSISRPSVNQSPRRAPLCSRLWPARHPPRLHSLVLVLPCPEPLLLRRRALRRHRIVCCRSGAKRATPESPRLAVAAEHLASRIAVAAACVSVAPRRDHAAIAARRRPSFAHARALPASAPQLQVNQSLPSSVSFPLAFRRRAAFMLFLRAPLSALLSLPLGRPFLCLPCRDRLSWRASRRGAARSCLSPRHLPRSVA